MVGCGWLGRMVGLGWSAGMVGGDGWRGWREWWGAARVMAAWVEVVWVAFLTLGGAVRAVFDVPAYGMEVLGLPEDLFALDRGVQFVIRKNKPIWVRAVLGRIVG